MSLQILAKHYVALALIAMFAGVALVSTGAPARAAEVILDGVTYELIDDADPSAGAVVVAYDGAATSHPNVTVVERAQIGPDSVPVVSIADEAFLNAGVESVNLPAALLSMGDNVFGGNPDLNFVMFFGTPPTTSGNPIATDLATDPQVRFRVEFLSNFQAAPWTDFDTVPVALVNWADPHLGVPMPMSGLYVPLDQGDPSSPHGFIPDGHNALGFEIAAPAGYELAGWLANGEPWEIGSPITESMVFTPLWTDLTRVATVVITASAASVEEGGSVTFAAEGFNAVGDSLGDVTADTEFSSDVATDQINGATVTFPTASPHTISALHLPTEIRAEPVVIEVLETAIDDDEEVVDETPAAADSVTPMPAAAGASDASGVQLAESGWGDHAGTLVAAAMLSLLGTALIATRRHPALRFETT